MVDILTRLLMRQALSKNEELSVLGSEFGVSVVRGDERLTDCGIGEAIGQSDNQSISQSVNQSISQSVNDLMMI